MTHPATPVHHTCGYKQSGTPVRTQHPFEFFHHRTIKFGERVEYDAPDVEVQALQEVGQAPVQLAPVYAKKQACEWMLAIARQ